MCWLWNIPAIFISLNPTSPNSLPLACAPDLFFSFLLRCSQTTFKLFFVFSDRVIMLLLLAVVLFYVVLSQLFDPDNIVNRYADQFIFSTEGHPFRIHPSFRAADSLLRDSSFPATETVGSRRTLHYIRNLFSRPSNTSTHSGDNLVHSSNMVSVCMSVGVGGGRRRSIVPSHRLTISAET